jgi:16S rRNA (cytosine967-C5)-methyltransferase
MAGRGQIVATDARPSALRELDRRTRSRAVGILRWQQLDAAAETPGGQAFDGVLIDAPCSGIGTWSRNPDARWRTARGDIASRAELQTRLLANAAPRVKPGGVLVYAVCTVTEAETNDVIRSFLATHSNFALDPLDHPLAGARANGELRVWPWDGPCDGMYIARMRRRG